MRRVGMVYEALVRATRPGVVDGFQAPDLHDKSTWNIIWNDTNLPTQNEYDAASKIIETFDATKDYPFPKPQRILSDEMLAVISIAHAIIVKGLMTVEDFSPEVRDLLPNETAE